VDSIVNGLFPKDDISEWPPWAEHHVFPEVTTDEVRELSRRIPLGKAPDPDEVPDMVIKELAARKQEMLRDVFNCCLTEAFFLPNGKWLNWFY